MIRHPNSSPAGRVGAGLVVIASILLAGIVLLAVGHFTESRVPFYAGLMVILVGVFTGVQRIVFARGGEGDPATRP